MLPGAITAQENLLDNLSTITSTVTSTLSSSSTEILPSLLRSLKGLLPEGVGALIPKAYHADSHIPVGVYYVGLNLPNSWYQMIENVSVDNYFLYFLLMIFLVITALGILNLIVGCMVVATFEVVQKENSRLRKVHVMEAKKNIVQAKLLFFTKQNNDTKKKLYDDSNAEEVIFVNLSTMEKALAKDRALSRALEQAGITTHKIRLIFHKLLPHPNADLPLSTFMDAALRVSQSDDLQAVDVISCKVTMTKLLQDLKVLQAKIKEVNDIANEREVSPRHGGKFGHHLRQEFRLDRDEHPVFLEKALRQVSARNKDLTGVVYALRKLVEDVESGRREIDESYYVEKERLQACLRSDYRDVGGG